MNVTKGKKGKHEKKLKYGCKINTTEDIGLIESCGGGTFSKIIKTSTEPRINYYETWRPKKGFCLKYDLSQTNFYVDTKRTKFNVKDTTVSYVPNPHPPRADSGTYQSNGLGPQWEMVDEKWRARRDAKQAECLALLKKRLHMKRRAQEELKKKITFNILCRNLRKNPRVKLKMIEKKHDD